MGGGFGWLTGRLRLSWTQRSVRIELEDLRDEAQWECPTAGVAFQPTVDLGQRPSVKGTEPPNAYFQLLVGPSLDCRRARGVDDLIELGTRVRRKFGACRAAHDVGPTNVYWRAAPCAIHPQSLPDSVWAVPQ